MDKFFLKILPKGINKMIFYKKIIQNHIIEFKKSYIYLGTYIIETEILIDESVSNSNFKNENSEFLDKKKL